MTSLGLELYNELCKADPLTLEQWLAQPWSYTERYEKAADKIKTLVLKQMEPKAVVNYKEDLERQISLF